MNKSSILVIGSINMDLVFNPKRYPIKGETTFSKCFYQIPGGKGANQAYTISKLGTNVGFVGAIGNDGFGKDVARNLEDVGVNIDNLYSLDIHTGVASICVEENGDNRIIVAQGANGKITAEMVDKVTDKIQCAEVLLLQLEIPLSAVMRAIEIAKDSDTIVILDPAPARPLPEIIYSQIDYLLPNEGELDILLSNYKLKGRREKANKLLKLGVKNLIITRGEKGVEFYSEKSNRYYPALKVDAVDTTAAGDAFAGALAFGLEKKWELDELIDFATTVAAISVTRVGAQSSLPAYEEVEKFINKKKVLNYSRNNNLANHRAKNL